LSLFGDFQAFCAISSPARNSTSSAYEKERGSTTPTTATTFLAFFCFVVILHLVFFLFVVSLIAFVYLFVVFLTVFLTTSQKKERKSIRWEGAGKAKAKGLGGHVNG
jgi:Ca2+/Na+ antiporter